MNNRSSELETGGAVDYIVTSVVCPKRVGSDRWKTRRKFEQILVLLVFGVSVGPQSGKAWQQLFSLLLVLALT